MTRSNIEHPLSKQDYHDLAALHSSCLPDSLVSKLGERYAEAFYRYLDASDLEEVIVHRDQGRIQAACVLSLAPQSLKKRLLLRTPIVFHPCKVLKLFLHKRSTKPKECKPLSDNVRKDAPELIIIYTSSQLRGKSIGAKMVAQVEQFLTQRDISYYHVKTVDEPENRALSFYLKNGFDRIATTASDGKVFALFGKQLPKPTP